MSYNSVQIGNALTFQIKTLNTVGTAVNPSNGHLLSIYDSSNPPWNPGSVARVVDAGITGPGTGEDHGPVTQVAQGTFEYTYNVSANAVTGVWWCVWSATIENKTITETLKFTVTGAETNTFSVSSVNTPKHEIRVLAGASATFDVVLHAGGIPANPVDGSVTAKIFSPRDANGGRLLVAELTGTETGDVGAFSAVWDVPAGSLISDDWEIQWYANFSNVGALYPNEQVLVGSEYFEVVSYLGPVFGDFGTNSSINDVRFTFPPIDTFLDCYPDKSTRDSLISYCLKRSHEWLNEQLSLLQVRASSEDRRQIETDYAIYLLLRGNFTGKRSDAAKERGTSWIERFKTDAEGKLKQLKREGVFGAVPIGRA